MGQCSAWSYVAVEAVTSARAERQLQHRPAATASAARGGEAIMPTRPEGLAGAATASFSPRIRSRSICDVCRACLGQRTPISRVVVSSVAGLIITVTDGEGEVIEREAGCATGLGPVAHDGGRSLCVRLRRPQASMVLI